MSIHDFTANTPQREGLEELRREQANFISLLSKHWKEEGLNQNLEQLNLLGDDISPAAYYGFILGKGDDIVVFADLRRDSL